MLFFFIILLNVFINEITMDSMGPYTFKIDSIEPCKNPPEPRAVPLPYHVEQYTLRGEALFRWNITLNKREGPVKAIVTLSQYKNKTYEYVKVYDINASPCSHPMLKIIMQVGNLTNVNIRRCTVSKGIYAMDGLNANFLLHKLVRVLQYGTYRAIVITTAPDGLISCTEVMAHVVPLSSQRHERNSHNY